MGSPRRRGSRSGFTLLELVVVLLILGLAMSVTLPAIRGRGPAAARTVADAIAALCTAARDAAATRGSPVTLTVELATGAFALTAQAPPGSPDTLRSGRLDLAGARLEGGRDGWATLTFHPLGQVRADRIVVGGGTGRHEIVVSPWNATVATTPAGAPAER